jgi:nanoRNase/pAp phosphatase (c-di-AMP/oligoRNAs hydrolase)
VQPSSRQRLITRSDFDGLVCAVLLKHLDLIDEILFVHPKDMQDGKIPVGARDITAKLPYVAGAHLAFDNHVSEARRQPVAQSNHVIDALAPSTARVLYEHYGGFRRFPARFDAMLAAVDKSTTGAFSFDDVLHPKGWELLSFLMDARTGLGRFQAFRISNYALMHQLVGHCLRLEVDELLELEDVRERVELYFDHEQRFQAQIRLRAQMQGDVAVLDLRREETIYAGNRYTVFALLPQCSVSLHVLWGRDRCNTVFAANRSVFNRRCQASMGELMLRYGGGGHHGAGTCQVDNSRAAKVLGELIEQLRSE